MSRQLEDWSAKEDFSLSENIKPEDCADIDSLMDELVGVSSIATQTNVSSSVGAQAILNLSSLLIARSVVMYPQ